MGVVVLLLMLFIHKIMQVLNFAVLLFSFKRISYNQTRPQREILEFVLEQDIGEK